MASSASTSFHQYIEREFNLIDFITPNDDRKDSAVAIVSSPPQYDGEDLPVYTASAVKRVRWADHLPTGHNYEHSKPSTRLCHSKVGTAGTTRRESKKGYPANQSMNAVIGRINGLLREVGLTPIKTTTEEERIFERRRYLQVIADKMFFGVDCSEVVNRGGTGEADA